MSLSKKLFLAISLNILANILVWVVGEKAVMDLFTVKEEMKVTGQATRNIMLADMMHDALRADVLNALYASGEPTSGISKETIRQELNDHSNTFESAIKENESLPLSDAAKQRLSAVKPKLEDYKNKASEIIELSYTSRSDAINMMPEFVETFDALATEMEATADALSADAEISRR